MFKATTYQTVAGRRDHGRGAALVLLYLLLGQLAVACGDDEPQSEDVNRDADDAAFDAYGDSDTPLGDTGPVDAPSVGDSDGDEPALASGELLVLTYNVAGLPRGVSSSNPHTNIPQISPLLNGYDLVLAQEDFWYHTELIADVEHPYLSAPYREPPVAADIGDGLNRMSTSPFDNHQRTPWPGCHGTDSCAADCFAKKGFSYARHELADGVLVDVYNLHNEAGSCPEDVLVRDEGARQLLVAMAERSDGLAIIVGGDFNLHDDDEEDLPTLQRYADFGLRDACESVGCDDQTIDRIMVRDGDDLEIEVLDRAIATEFVDADGEPLSDHRAVRARLTWRRP